MSEQARFPQNPETDFIVDTILYNENGFTVAWGYWQPDHTIPLALKTLVARLRNTDKEWIFLKECCRLHMKE